MTKRMIVRVLVTMGVLTGLSLGVAAQDSPSQPVAPQPVAPPVPAPGPAPSSDENAPNPTPVPASSPTSVPSAEPVLTSAPVAPPSGMATPDTAIVIAKPAAEITTPTANESKSAEAKPAITRPIPDDLWQRVRRGFQLSHLDSPFTQNHEQWYASRPDYIQRFVDRGARYLYHIVEEVERRNMPTEIVLLPIIESAFNPQSLSSAKAVGMWQFMPSTGQRFGLKQDWLADNRRDVLLSTDAALDYLQKLYGMFNSWELALAAYNCGEGCVGRAIAANTRKGLPTDLMSLNLPNETRNYVPKLLAVKNIVLSPGSFGIDLTSVENRPYFAKVSAPAKIDVKLAARLAEMEEEEFAALNPAFRRPVASSGTGFFLVPTDKGPVFEENLKLYRSLNGPMVSWQTVHASRGESVDVVARRYGMTASYLRATSGPFAERKGKFTQPVTFMAPNASQAKAITAALDKKVALRNSGATEGLMLASHTPIAAHGRVTHSDLSASPLPLLQDRDIILDGKLIRAGGQRVESAVDSVANSSPVSYVVKAGDTLTALASRFGLTVEQIMALNALSGTALRIGQTLLLAGSPAEIVVTAAPEAPTLYAVQTGDTLYGIAQKFGVSVENLLQWNQLSTKAVIVPGKLLRISA